MSRPGAIWVAVFLLALVLAGVVPAGPVSAMPDASEVWLKRVVYTAELGVSEPVGLAVNPDDGIRYLVEESGGKMVSLTPTGDLVGVVELTGLSDPLLVTHADDVVQLLTPAGLLAIDLDVPSSASVIGRPAVTTPVGMTHNPTSDETLILDAAGPRIVGVRPDGSSKVTVLTELAGRAVRGIAHNPEDGLTYVMTPDNSLLWGLDGFGSVQSRFDLSPLGLVAPGAISFGPSTDTTDDPSTRSLFIADSGSGNGEAMMVDGIATVADDDSATAGRLIEVALGPEPALAEAAVPASLIDTTLLWQLDPPSPDSAGITYISSRDRLLVSDSEVNEMTIFENVNLYELSRTAGTLRDTGVTSLWSNEPTGVSFNAANQHLFVSDDTGTRAIYEVDPVDSRYGNGDDQATEIPTEPFGSADPEGVAFDPDTGRLFIVDGVNSQVYELAPGSNGVFDGVHPDGDDVASSFDVSTFGAQDPEGIAYNPFDSTLLVLDAKSDSVYEVTTGGSLVRIIDIAAANATKAAGLVLAPASTGSGGWNMYIVARGVDNGADPNENDGVMYEMALDFGPASGPPTAVDDTTVTAAATSVNIDVLENDTDPDGDPMTVTNLSSAANGSTVVEVDETITYTPNPGFVGVDTFTYTANDGSADSNTATVAVTVGLLVQFAESETTIMGSRTGDLADTRSTDGVYEELTEEHTGGPPRRRESELDHRWTFDVTRGDRVRLVTTAYRNANTENDDFELQFSADGGATFASLTPAVFISTDAPSTLAGDLPISTSGLVVIRAVDTDRTSGNGATDSIFVDYLAIETENPLPALPSVSVTATDSSAAESGDPGQFTVSRTTTVGSLTVTYAVSGTATSGLDYQILSGPITLADGVSQGVIDVVPIDDALPEGTETVAISIQPDSTYDVGAADSDTVFIDDDDFTGEDYVASAESTARGSIDAGSYQSTWQSDDVYEQIVEQVYAGGKRSRLQHEWSFDVVGGGAVEFFVEAHHTPGEDFVFQYSFDGTGWTTMLTVTKTADDGSTQSYLLPGGTSGEVRVRVLDADRSRGEGTAQTILVDHMFLRLTP